jgi:hypothetical protein
VESDDDSSDDDEGGKSNKITTESTKQKPPERHSQVAEFGANTRKRKASTANDDAQTAEGHTSPSKKPRPDGMHNMGQFLNMPRQQSRASGRAASLPPNEPVPPPARSTRRRSSTLTLEEKQKEDRKKDPRYDQPKDTGHKKWFESQY